MDKPQFLQTPYDEGLKQNQSHLLGDATLMKFQFRANDNDGTTRVIHSLTEKVLSKTTLFALQHIAERLQRPVAGACDGTAMTTIVKKGVNRLLKHSFFVMYYNVRSLQLQKILEAIVSVDDSTIQVIQVTGGKTSTFQGNQGAQVRRNNWDCFEDHPFRTSP